MAAKDNLNGDQFDENDESTWYAPKTPDHVMRAASLAGAKHFKSEHVKAVPIAGHTNKAAVYEVTNERWPTGENKLGRSVMVTYKENGRHHVRKEY